MMSDEEVAATITRGICRGICYTYYLYTRWNGTEMIDNATVTAIIDSLTCHVCLEPAIEAYAPPCRHYICKYCLKKWMLLYQKKRCSFCTQDLHRPRRCKDIDVILEYFDPIYKQTKNATVASRKKQWAAEVEADMRRRLRRERRRLEERRDEDVMGTVTPGPAYNALRGMLRFCCGITGNRCIDLSPIGFACRFKLSCNWAVTFLLTYPDGRFNFDYNLFEM